MLAGAHGAHRREVAYEIGRAGDQLEAQRRQATDEVQLVAFTPVAQGQGRAPGAGLVVAGAAGHP